MRPDRKKRKLRNDMAVWLAVCMSATLLMPFHVSGKYKSEFAQTVDIIVFPALSAEGIPEDGTLINDSCISTGGEEYEATTSEATASETTTSEATASEANTH